MSLHGGWAKTDLFLKAVVEGWQVTAKAFGSVPEMVILSIFPWRFTPELYATKPEYIRSLADFVRGRPAQPLPAFLQESSTVITHKSGFYRMRFSERNEREKGSRRRPTRVYRRESESTT